MKSHRYILKLLLALILITGCITPSHSFSQDNKSSGIPTWAELTFWGSFTLVLGKVFIYDKYFKSSGVEEIMQQWMTLPLTQLPICWITINSIHMTA